ncbi:MAG: DUF1553 domain-containing protein, partial [Planctomycetales bacterium]|nr:DUF1553 domain-containing protein [Planctomycetales bacterium]
LDRWTQDDYHGLAAVFAGLVRGQEVQFVGRGEVTHPRTGVAAIPKIPGNRFLNAAADPRQDFAAWVINSDNPYFAKAIIARVWESLMGRGLVTPVDDLRATNPASHPKLFNRLAENFVQNDFKLKPLIRQICASAAYQRSSRVEGDRVDDAELLRKFYAVANVKPLSAEVLSDAIRDVTNVPDEAAGSVRAIQVVDRSSLAEKLQFLGQCLPGETCSTDPAAQRGITSKLHLMNGDLLNVQIRDPRCRLQTMLQNGTSTDAIVDKFYRRALGRNPSRLEDTTWADRLSGADHKERCEDFLWALLNCQEFTTNQ